MSLRRRIKYQIKYYCRFLVIIGRCLVPPPWLTGRGARIVCLGLLALAFILYISETSRAAGSGYEMKSLQKQVKELQAEIQEIDVDIASQNSMSGLEARLKDVNLVALQEIKYIKATAAEVAKK